MNRAGWAALVGASCCLVAASWIWVPSRALVGSSTSVLQVNTGSASLNATPLRRIDRSLDEAPNEALVVSQTTFSPRESSMKQVITTKDLPRKPHPVKIDASFHETVTQYAARAAAGEAGAAIRLAEVTRPLGLGMDTLGAPLSFPAGVSRDSLYWLKEAARLGSPEAAVKFASEITAMTRTPQFIVAYGLTAEQVADLQSEGRRLLAWAIGQGFAEAFLVAFSSHRNGELGVPVSAARAHACVAYLAANMSNAGVEARYKWSKENTSSADLIQAQMLLQSDRPCAI